MAALFVAIGSKAAAARCMAGVAIRKQILAYPATGKHD